MEVRRTEVYHLQGLCRRGLRSGGYNAGMADSHDNHSAETGRMPSWKDSIVRTGEHPMEERPLELDDVDLALIHGVLDSEPLVTRECRTIIDPITFEDVEVGPTYEEDLAARVADEVDFRRREAERRANAGEELRDPHLDAERMRRDYESAYRSRVATKWYEGGYPLPCEAPTAEERLAAYLVVKAHLDAIEIPYATPDMNGVPPMPDPAPPAPAPQPTDADINRIFGVFETGPTAEEYNSWPEEVRQRYDQESAAVLEEHYLDEEHGFGRFRIYDESELGSFPPVEWHPGLTGVLPRRELVGLWGPGDSYKSFTALDWVCYLASSGFPVLYIAAEGASGLRKRVAAWKTLHEVEEIPQLKFQPLPVRMHEPGDVDLFVRAIRAQVNSPLYLVVVDTLARNFVGGNENSAQDMGLFVEGAERIRRDFGCTVVVVHHSTKDGTSERGGESLRNASFAMYRFERVGGKTVKVTGERMKDAEKPAPVTLHPIVVELDPLGEETSLVADWPYDGDARREKTIEEMLGVEDSKFRARAEMAAAITEVVQRLGTPPEYLSQTQVVKKVKGRDQTIAALLKELALDPISPVQSEKDAKGIRYFFEALPAHD